MELGPYTVRDIFPAEGNRVLVYCSVQDGEQCGAVLSFFARRSQGWERGMVITVTGLDEPMVITEEAVDEPVTVDEPMVVNHGTSLENPDVPSIDADRVLPDLCIDR